MEWLATRPCRWDSACNRASSCSRSFRSTTSGLPRIFRETQLRRMIRGQPVTVHVDTTERDYQGYVEGMPGATGELYSLLPPENATGNYVKVVQRLPVRIRLNPREDEEHRLRPGMAGEPTGRGTGHPATLGG